MNMKLNRLARPLAGALVLGLAAAAPGTLHAQRAAIPDPIPLPGPLPVKMLTLPCCRCLDGSVQTVNISTGSAVWTVQPPSGPVQTATPSNNVAWTNALAPATWLGTQNGQPGTYTFELRFRIPNCTIRPTVILSGAFSADNGGTVSLITGPMTPVSGPYPFGFQATVPFTSGSLPSGNNYILRVTVKNQSGPVGMVLKGTLTIRCPKDVIKTDPIEQTGDPVDPT
jgi:hypothetical protein